MWPFSKKLEDVLYKTKTVYVHGVKFIIKKIDTSNYLEGSKIMLQYFDVYKLGATQSEEITNSRVIKVKEHYKDMFLASVVYPKLARKEGESGLPADHLFTEWDMAHELYSKILEYTYGKKKFKVGSSPEVSSQT